MTAKHDSNSLKLNEQNNVIVNELIVDKTDKTGMEAADIVEDALQLAIDDELKEEREDIVIADKINASKVNSTSSRNEVNSSQKYNEDDVGEDNGVVIRSPPKPDTTPVVVPLTVEDTINLGTAKQDNSADDASLIVNVDDTQCDLLDPDLDVSNVSTTDNADNESINRANSMLETKSSNEANASIESKIDSSVEKDLNTNSNAEDSNNFNSSKDYTKDSDKDASSKFKSSNAAKDGKTKTKNTKSATAMSGASNGRNIWVSGLSQSAKASELQTLFSKHGKVVSAKIIKNTRLPASRCYGFITMENSDQVNKCINHLNKTELHGRIILLSRNRPQESSSKVAAVRSKGVAVKRENLKKLQNKSLDSKKESTKDIEIKDIANKETENIELKESNVREEKDQNKISDEDLVKEIRKPIRAPFRDNYDRGRSIRKPVFNHFRRPFSLRRPFLQRGGPSYRGFRKPIFARSGFRTGLPIKRIDFDRNLREREREREMREEKRRREEIFRAQRDLEREERIRFEREKERLKFERLKLEREKAEFFRYERERAKLEREKIEREREELRRRQTAQIPLQTRVEESRARSAIVASAANKRSFDSRVIRSNNDQYWEERKRMQPTPRIESHILPSRQAYIETATNARHISHTYDNRNDSYKRARIDLTMSGNSRSEFDPKRHDSRHGGGHDRDERKSSSGGPSASYYRDSSRSAPFFARDRRFNSQRDEWKSGHDSRRDRYDNRQITSGSSSGFGGTSRYSGGDNRSWNDRGANTMNKLSYGSGNVHLSGVQPWNSSSGDRWNSAIGSSGGETRSRGQSLNTSLLSGSNTSISAIFGSNQIDFKSTDMTHGLGLTHVGSSGISAGDRQYVHTNRRF